MVTIRLHNSKTRRKEVFAPLDAANVRMYVCGPTVYDRAHLGNGRPVVVFDTLYRLLRHVYGAEHVTYVRNFTDVDDKINATALARKNAGDPRTMEALIAERTEETIGWYHADMDALGALRPDHEPRATEYIGPMVAMIQTLIESKNDEGKAFAYVKDGHVLFRVKAYKDYGALSGRSVDDMIAGARVEVAPFKEDPMDFVLWKPSSDEEPGWASPWGRGRPGWHIECSAMSYELLGASFDIHGGGLDLQFPHHENEIAQSCCAHPEAGFAQVWMHNEMLQVEGKKMSKSLGNFFTVRDLLDGTNGSPKVDPKAIRIAFLLSHYRVPMDFSKNRQHEAFVKSLTIGQVVVDGFEHFGSNWSIGTPYPEVVGALADDLNTRLAIDHLVRVAKSGINSLDKAGFADFMATAHLLGLDSYSEIELDAFRKLRKIATDFSDEVGKEFAALSLIGNIIDEARKAKNYALSDSVRAELNVIGVEVQMSEGKAFLVRRPGYDMNKLLELSGKFK